MQPGPSKNGTLRHSLGARPKLSSSASEYRTGVLQWVQIMRTSRCASTQFRAETKLYGSTPMFRKRPSTSTTLLAWTVVNTRWPVNADWIAIWGVSVSRISPDRKSVVEGKRVDLGGRRIIKKKKHKHTAHHSGAANALPCARRQQRAQPGQ